MQDKRVLGLMLLFVLGAYAVQTLYVISIGPNGELIGSVNANQTENVTSFNQSVGTSTSGLSSQLFGSPIWDIITFNVWAGMKNPEVVPAVIRYLVQLIIAGPINILGLICIIELVLQFIPFVGG